MINESNYAGGLAGSRFIGDNPRLAPDHPHFRPQHGEQWYVRIPGWKTREISTAEILSTTDKTVLMKLIMGDIAGAHWRYLISEVEWIERITKAGDVK